MPLTIDLLQNEEENLMKEYEKERFGESNFSNWNMVEEMDNKEEDNQEESSF